MPRTHRIATCSNALRPYIIGRNSSSLKMLEINLTFRNT
jgi:hypothetical protein